MGSAPAVGDRRPRRDAGVRQAASTISPAWRPHRHADARRRSRRSRDRPVDRRQPSASKAASAHSASRSSAAASAAGSASLDDQVPAQGLAPCHGHAGPQARAPRGRVRRPAPHGAVRPGRPGRTALQPAARRRPMSFSTGPWTSSEGRARRPLPSQASTSKSALSPARHRISSTSQRARPTPGGRQRRRRQRRDPPARDRLPSAGQNRRRPFAAAIGGWRCPIVPDSSAASCKRREPVIESRDLRDNAPSPPCRNPPRNRRGLILVAGFHIDHAVRRESRLREGRGEQIQARTHQRIFPLVRATMPAAKSAAAAPSIAPLPPPATSCSAPSANPPAGRCRSIALMPKGSTARLRPDAPSSPRMRSRSSSIPGWMTDLFMTLATGLDDVMFLICSHPAKRVR